MSRGRDHELQYHGKFWVILKLGGQGFYTYLAKGQSKAVGSVQFSLPFSHLHLEFISKVDFGDNFNYFGTWRLCLLQTEISEPFH